MDVELVKQLQDQGRRLKVLYVEDNDQARESTVDILDTFFPRIDTARDGEEGLQKFEQNGYDLVITDINMPKMNGLDMTKAIKKLNPAIPILVISAYNESNYFLETIKLGVEGYLLKPVDMDQFLQMIKKVTEKIALRKENHAYRTQLEHKVKKQVDELLQKDQIITEKSKLALMGEMIDAIAHQFKQPLSIIKLQAQQLEYAHEQNDIDRETILDSTKGTMQQVDHLLETIEEFRSFLRPDTQRELVVLKELIDSVLLLLQDELKRNSVMTKILGETQVTVNIIPTEFKHVLINLINNAKDAFEDRGIELQKQITFEIEECTNMIHLHIYDNAGGIPEKILPEIFKPNVTTKDFAKGTGIGLYISQMIIKKIGGDISACNIAEGAKFTIQIPKHEV